MPIDLQVTLETGHQWVVSSWHPGRVSIPVTELEGLSNQEIGMFVRELLSFVNKAIAIDVADSIVMNCKGRKPRHMPDSVLDNHELLASWAGTHHLIDEALEIIQSHIIYHENKQAKPAKRSQINNNYNHYFVTLGKRDGFQCCYCGSVQNLEIDHIHPLSHGGSNKVENLQLLCGTCNRQKSDQA